MKKDSRADQISFCHVGSCYQTQIYLNLVLLNELIKVELPPFRALAVRQSE